MSRFEFIDENQQISPADLQDLSGLISKAARQVIETDEERTRLMASQLSWGASEEGLEEWVEKARSLPASILLNEVAMILADEALSRGAEVRTISD